MTSNPIKRDGRGAPYDRKVLRRKRMEAGLSQAGLAELAKVSTSQISALECGDSGASPVALAAIAVALGCKPADLMIKPEVNA